MWPFKSGKTKAAPAKLVFKSPAAFFEYQCKFGYTEIRENQGMVALVEVGADLSITEENRSRDGHRQTAGLRVVSPDGGFEVYAQPFSDGPLLRVGDCVIWVPLEYNASLTVLIGDPRSGWIGFVVAKIAPEIDPSKSTFDVLCRYDHAAGA